MHVDFASLAHYHMAEVIFRVVAKLFFEYRKRMVHIVHIVIM